MNKGAKKLEITPEEITYTIAGEDLRSAIKSLEISQNEFARQCGFSGAAHITHLVNSPNPVRLKDTGTVLQTLLRLGVDIRGELR